MRNWNDIEDEGSFAPSATVVDIWTDPKPLPSAMPPVKAFDFAMLPPSLEPWVRDISERMQAPAEFVAVPAIVAAGSIIGRKIGIRPQESTDWYEVPNLWGCIVGRPGVMKSPAVQQALKPLNRLQADARREHEHAAAKFEAGELERELRADARKRLLKERLKQNPNADTGDLAAPDEEEPTLKRYLANDTSYQSLGELLTQNPNGLLVHRDELLSLLKSLDREDNVEARGFYLTAWNGTDDYVFDRITRGTNLYCPSVTVSMIGSTQPGKLRDYASAAIKGGAGDDGLMQRFSMAVWPDVTGAWVEHDREVDPIARNAAFKVFERLDRLNAAEVGAQHDPFDESRPFLRFDADGLALFREWRACHELRLRSGELHPAMESHLAKYRKLIPTLALIHHLASDNAGPVSELSVLSALTWGEYLESHANRIYATAIDRSASGARTIVRHLRNGGLESRFTARKVHRKEWSGLTDIADVTDALELLEERGFVRSIEVPTTAGGGRPTITYTVNPKVLKQ